jgi:hypothetical protein
MCHLLGEASGVAGNAKGRKWEVVERQTWSKCGELLHERAVIDWDSKPQELFSGPEPGVTRRREPLKEFKLPARFLNAAQICNTFKRRQQ